LTKQDRVPFSSDQKSTMACGCRFAIRMAREQRLVWRGNSGALANGAWQAENKKSPAQEPGFDF
jgi:hypothetical protein